eukprot:TRINITY_DN27806_c0_g1_i1.p1 TRINITY_DN27806_c0_g1~~TRINITY_DN27806_c0_g1_i1.p1  ORF type:complete len:183 (-),score=60.85 TRINITY_DN27806_c0_g1_i1:25-573(-)
MDTVKLSEDKAHDIGENLSSIVKEVKESVQKSKNMRAEEKSSPVDVKEFDELLENCQELLMDLESIKYVEEKSPTPPTTPEEFHDAKEAISASASFAEKKDVDAKVENIGEVHSIDDVDGSSLTKSKKTEEADASLKQEAQISFVAHQVKSFDNEEGDENKECELEESESMNVYVQSKHGRY